MKYVRSTSAKSYYANGVTIPKGTGKDYAVLDDGKWDELSKIPVIASLVKSGGIQALNKQPDELANSPVYLNNTLAELKRQNTILSEKLRKTADIDVEKVKADAVKELKAEAIHEIQNKQAELEKALAKIATLEKKLKEAEE